MKWIFGLVLSGMISLPAFARPVRIMPFGDSLTAGAYIQNGVFKTDSGYRETLWGLLTQDHDSVHFVGSFQDGLPGFTENHHEGHSGWRIDQISAGAQQWVTVYQPDIVLLLIGTNDCIQNHALDHAMARMDTLLNNILIAKPDVTVFISTTIPHSDPEVLKRVKDYNRELTAWVKAKQAKNPHIHFVDQYQDANLQISDLIDGVHPNPQGYATMGKVWFRALKRDYFHR